MNGQHSNPMTAKLCRLAIWRRSIVTGGLDQGRPSNDPGGQRIECPRSPGGHCTTSVKCRPVHSNHIGTMDATSRKPSTALSTRHCRSVRSSRASSSPASQARKLLALHDEIWAEMTTVAVEGQVRLGVPPDLAPNQHSCHQGPFRVRRGLRHGCACRGRNARRDSRASRTAASARAGRAPPPARSPRTSSPRGEEAQSRSPSPVTTPPLG